MATWRCPGCGTVQVDAGTCFVCSRSATSCATCAHFRRAVVSGLGYCAIDRRREPLTGAEERACWSSASTPAGDGLFALALAAEPAAAPRGLVEPDALAQR
jgi:hypothetical protein